MAGSVRTPALRNPSFGSQNDPRFSSGTSQQLFVRANVEIGVRSRPDMPIEDLMSAKVGVMNLAEPPMGTQNVPRYLKAAEG